MRYPSHRTPDANVPMFSRRRVRRRSDRRSGTRTHASRIKRDEHPNRPTTPVEFTRTRVAYWTFRARNGSRLDGPVASRRGKKPTGRTSLKCVFYFLYTRTSLSARFRHPHFRNSVHSTNAVVFKRLDSVFLDSDTTVGKPYFIRRDTHVICFTFYPSATPRMYD